MSVKSLPRQGAKLYWGLSSYNKLRLPGEATLLGPEKGERAIKYKDEGAEKNEQKEAPSWASVTVKPRY